MRASMDEKRFEKHRPGGVCSFVAPALPALVVIAFAWMLAVAFACPYLSYLMCTVKSGASAIPAALDLYFDRGASHGWETVGSLQNSSVPSAFCVALVSALAVGVGVFAIARSLTAREVKELFGPAAEASNEKGSARLICNELELAGVVETWDGSWENPPVKPVPVLGYSRRFGYYLAPAESHTVTFGMPGSGKTTRVNYATIDALCASGASIVVTDPKGELYGGCASELRERGVKTYVIDFRSPKRSCCINPLSLVTSAYFKGSKEADEAMAEAAHIKRSLEESGLSAEDDPVAQKRYLDALRRADAARRAAWSQAENYALDLAAAIVPERENAGGAKHWEDVARLVIKSLALLVGTYTERDFVGEGAPFTEPLEHQRTLETVHYLLREYGGIERGVKKLDVIMSNLDADHPARVNFAQAKASEDREYAIAISESIKFLDAMLGMSVNAFLNKSDFDLASVGKEQCAIFVVLPDDRPAVGKMFTVLVTQLYQALIAEAANYGNVLPVPVHFLLEEFGNIQTPIPDFPTKLAMSRSYQIFFHLTLQGMNQLSRWYGESGQADIFDKIAVRTLISTNDAQKCGRYFSDNMGYYTYLSSRTSRSRETLGLIDKTKTYSKACEQRPVMYPDEVVRWNPEWGSIVLASKAGKAPSWWMELVFGHKTMMPAVFPSEPAWKTPTARNLRIGSKDQMAAKVALAEAESRLESRIPNSVWEPVNLEASERIEARRAMLSGGVSARAQADFDAFCVREEAKSLALKVIAERVSEQELFEKGASYVDAVAKESVEYAAGAYPHDDKKRSRLRAAAVSGIVYDVLTRALAEGDPSILRASSPPAGKEASLAGKGEAAFDPAAKLSVEKRVRKSVRRDNSHLDKLRKAIREALSQACTWEGFALELERRGVRMVERSDGLSFVLASGKSARDRTLDKKGSFTKEEIERRLGANAQEAECER